MAARTTLPIQRAPCLDDPRNSNSLLSRIQLADSLATPAAARYSVRSQLLGRPAVSLVLNQLSRRLRLALFSEIPDRRGPCLARPIMPRVCRTSRNSPSPLVVYSEAACSVSRISSSNHRPERPEVCSATSANHNPLLGRSLAVRCSNPLNSSR